MVVGKTTTCLSKVEENGINDWSATHFGTKLRSFICAWTVEGIFGKSVGGLITVTISSKGLWNAPCDSIMKFDRTGVEYTTSTFVVAPEVKLANTIWTKAVQHPIHTMLQFTEERGTSHRSVGGILQKRDTEQFS